LGGDGGGGGGGVFVAKKGRPTDNGVNRGHGKRGGVTKRKYKNLGTPGISQLRKEKKTTKTP